MKKTILLFAILLSNFSNAQSKQETIDWLNLKLKEYTDSFMGEFSMQIKNEPGWGDTVVISSRVENEYMASRIDTYSFLATNITAVVTTSKFRTDGKLGIQIISNGGNIYYNKKEFVKDIDILCKPAPDETIIRMQKGIIHLLNLMGNPITEPKELFQK